MHWPTENENKLFDDHMKFRDSLSALAYQKANLFPKLVMTLWDRGMLIDEAQRMAGEATMRLPHGTIEECVDCVLNILAARAAA
jgi:hypothetical protein